MRVLLATFRFRGVFLGNILASRHLSSPGWLLGIFVKVGARRGASAAAISTYTELFTPFLQPCSDAAHLPAVTTAARLGCAGPFHMAASSGWYVNTCQRRFNGEQPQSRLLLRKFYTS